MTKENLDFSILKVADVTQGEFAQLCGVSRVTVNWWVNGKVTPNRFVVDKVERELARIRAAVNGKALPLPGHVRYGKGRLKAVENAISYVA